MSLLAQIDTHAATLAQTEGSNRRRQDDWTFQASQASMESAHLDKQIAAATIHVTIAEQELQNHIQQKSNNQALDDYMHTKFTNQDLYDWMVSQISSQASSSAGTQPAGILPASPWTSASRTSVRL